MAKKSKFKQMAVLSAGTFANVLTAIFFFMVMWLFFSLAFAPSGVVFDSYAYSVVGMATISSVNGITLSNVSYEKVFSLINETGLNKIKAEDGDYVVTKDFLENQKDNEGFLFLYHDSPAINAGLNGAIIEINGIKINERENLIKELSKYSPDEQIKIKTKILDDSESEVLEYNIILGEHPEKENSPWLGIGFIEQKQTGIMNKIVNFFSTFKKSHVYYEPKFGASLFIYNLLWWLILINISVALINMLPMGIFDGGRFFYLTVLAITKSENKARKTFKFLTYFFLFLVFLLLAFWVFSFIK